MKKILSFLGVLTLVLVAGCESRPCYKDNPCGRGLIEREPAPVAAYEEPRAVACEPRTACAEPRTAVCADPSGACGTHLRTVREPVEVVYKRTVYKTVYEPRTSKTVAYEREAYNAPEKVSYKKVSKAKSEGYYECADNTCYKR